MPIPKKASRAPKKASLAPAAETTSPPSIFLIQLTFHVTSDKIAAALPQHLAFLDKYYKKRQFLVSGGKIPFTGGIIIARAKDQKQVEQIVKQDPFIKKNLASADIIEFSANQTSKEVASWLADV